MRIFLAGLGLCVALILQMAVQQSLPLPAVPGILLAYLCIFLLFRPLEEVLWYGLASGVLLDIFSGLPDGAFAIAVPISLVLAYYLGQSVLTQRLTGFLLPFYGVVATLGLFAGVLLAQAVFALLGWIQSPEWGRTLAVQLPLSIGFNLLALLPAYAVYYLQEKTRARFWPKS